MPLRNFLTGRTQLILQRSTPILARGSPFLKHPLQQYLPCDINLVSIVNFIQVIKQKLHVWSLIGKGISRYSLTGNIFNMKKIVRIFFWYNQSVRDSKNSLDHLGVFTNKEVLLRMNIDKKLILIIKGRKLQYITRGGRYQLLQIIMQVKIVGRRSTGRSRNSWLKNLREWYILQQQSIFQVWYLEYTYIPDDCLPSERIWQLKKNMSNDR